MIRGVDDRIADEAMKGSHFHKEEDDAGSHGCFRNARTDRAGGQCHRGKGLHGPPDSRR
ncbi:hypothetical protein DESC_270054 [Desulfosarcina cetonica]|nr:hypothetical protein DESC_270054 [Desulfosarcina cetonica]